MTGTEWLAQNLEEGFDLTGDAHDWLMGLWNAIQVFDDMADGDFPNRDDLMTAISDTLCIMPANPFFRANMDTLLPLVAVAIMKWRASDDAERKGAADEMSYAWRAGFYDIVLAVVQIVHGHDVAMAAAVHVMRLYGEKYADYSEEFKDA